MLSKALLRRQINQIKWISLILLTLGCGLSQVKDIDNVGGLIVDITAITWILIQASLSSFAGILARRRAHLLPTLMVRYRCIQRNGFQGAARRNTGKHPLVESSALQPIRRLQHLHRCIFLGSGWSPRYCSSTDLSGSNLVFSRRQETARQRERKREREGERESLRERERGEADRDR